MGVSYSPKFLGVYGSLGLEELVIDLKQVNEQEIMDKIAYAFRNRDVYQRRLREIYPLVEREISKSFASILK